MSDNLVREIIKNILEQVECDYCVIGVLDPKGDAGTIIAGLADAGYKISKMEENK